MANTDVFANRRANLRSLITQHEGATNLAKQSVTFYEIVLDEALACA